jgi:hypothetical protein
MKVEQGNPHPRIEPLWKLKKRVLVYLFRASNLTGSTQNGIRKAQIAKISVLPYIKRTAPSPLLVHAMPEDSPDRTWREVAEELSKETNQQRIAELAQELDRKLAEWQARKGRTTAA